MRENNLNYFDFSANDDKVFIPKSRSVKKKKEKSCLVDRNKISSIKDTEALERYNAITSQKVTNNKEVL